MKVITGLDATDLRSIPEQVKRAEALGFDGVDVGETRSTPFLPLLLAAEHSTSLQLFTTVAIAFPRSPFVMAQTAWELQRFSQGRFALGLGTQVKGHNERRFSSPWHPPGPRMRDYIRCLRAVWDSFQHGTQPSYQGPYYTFTLLPPFFNPGPISASPPPVHIAGVNRYMLRLAGEECDGIVLHSFNTLKYTEEVVLPTLEEGARRAGRSLNDIAVSGGGFVIVGRDREEVERKRQDVKGNIAFYASTRTYKPVLDVHGWGEIVEPLHELSLKGRWQQMAALVTDEMVDAFATCGTYDEIALLLKRRYGGISTWVSLPLATSSPSDEARLSDVVRALHQEAGRSP